MRPALVTATTVTGRGIETGFPAYPINFVIAGAPALVIGGGPVAARKVDGLLAAGAVITLVAPDAVDELKDRPGVRWHQREYRRGEVASYRLAISATGVRSVDEQVFADATASGIPVNVADVPDLCTFTLPAILRRGDVQVTVSTNGRSPAMASWLRDLVGDVITPQVAEALDFVAKVRRELQAAGHATEIPGWHEAFDAGIVDLVANGEHDKARLLLLESLDRDPAVSPAVSPA
jgi:precorrin-2 dehydrogenase / sirohydrochlorin ferrochelatase